MAEELSNNISKMEFKIIKLIHENYSCNLDYGDTSALSTNIKRTQKTISTHQGFPPVYSIGNSD